MKIRKKKRIDNRKTRAKIPSAAIPIILKLALNGTSFATLSRKYNVSNERIRQIVLEKLDKSKKEIVEENLVRSIPKVRRLYSKGDNITNISSMLGICSTTLYHYIKRKGIVLIRPEKICSFKGCKEKVTNYIYFAKVKRGYCPKHYNNVYYRENKAWYSAYNKGRRNILALSEDEKCSVPDCEFKKFKDNICFRHYDIIRLKKYKK